MPSDQTDTYHLFGNLLRFHARNSEGAGAYSLVETLTAPGAGAPPNRHPGDDEAFFILDGTFEFVIDDETIRASGGAFVAVPNGAVHSFTNVGEAPGRLLIINSPGRDHDSFFSEAGDPMPTATRELPAPTGEAPDVARLVEVGRRNGIEFLLPDTPPGPLPAT